MDEIAAAGEIKLLRYANEETNRCENKTKKAQHQQDSWPPTTTNTKVNMALKPQPLAQREHIS